MAVTHSKLFAVVSTHMTKHQCSWHCALAAYISAPPELAERKWERASSYHGLVITSLLDAGAMWQRGEILEALAPLHDRGGVSNNLHAAAHRLLARQFENLAACRTCATLLCCHQANIAPYKPASSSTRRIQSR
eukprot:4943-Heterococcus_DN1.PRE.2